jgi:hypothetical protein
MVAFLSVIVSLCHFGMLIDWVQLSIAVLARGVRGVPW